MQHFYLFLYGKHSEKEREISHPLVRPQQNGRFQELGTQSGTSKRVTRSQPLEPTPSRQEENITQMVIQGAAPMPALRSEGKGWAYQH